jgi:O-antigen ligase
MRTALESLRREAPVVSLWLGALMSAVILGFFVVDLMMDRRGQGLLQLIVLGNLALAFVFYPFGLLQFVFASIVGEPFPGAIRGVLLLGLAVSARRFLDLALAGRSLRNVVSAPALWAGFFILAQVMSLVNAEDMPAAITGVRVYIQVLAIFFLIADFVRGERELKWIMITFIAAGLVNVGVAIYEAELGVERSAGWRGNANGFGMMQLLLLCLVSPLFMSARAVWQRMGVLLWGSVVVYSVILAGSRTVFVATLAAAAFFIFLTRGVPFRTRAVFGFCTLALAAAVLWVAPAEFIGRIATIPTTMEGAESSDSSIVTRLQYYRAGIQMGLDNPWTGIGARQFDEQISVYVGRQMYRARGAHSMYIGVFAESGFPGLVAFLGLLTSVAIVVRSRRIGHPVSRIVAASGVAVELALVAVIVGGIWSMLHYSKATWVLVALAVVVRRMSWEPNERAT